MKKKKKRHYRRRPLLRLLPPLRPPFLPSPTLRRHRPYFWQDYPRRVL